ncbi:MAG: hypothetical protein SGJ19_27835 [Planctomycetia bacterium]|nr:hypothetical protein [Planctomycetia bacterium]
MNDENQPWQSRCTITQEVFTQRMLIWKDLMDTCEQLLLAGLRHKIGPDGNLDEAYADWVRQDNARRSREKYARYRTKPQ